MRIPFDVKYKPQIESGEYKVETGDGKQVRIVSWDKNGFECKEIVALVANVTGTESCNIYTINGLVRSNSCQKNMNLFIVTPEEELTEFEQGLVNFFNERNAILPDKDGVYNKRDCEELLHKSASKLLAIAEKELSAKYKVSSDMNGFAYGKGYADGMKEALKDLPRWKKVGLDTGQTTLMIGYTGDEDKLYRNGYVISLTDLEKLPKEDE